MKPLHLAVGQRAAEGRREVDLTRPGTLLRPVI
jgi:hypothetical protein